MLAPPFGSYATYPGASPQPPPPPSAAQRSHVHFNHISHLSHQLNQLNLNHLGHVNFYPQPVFYWSYPSPPVSPTHYYGPHHAQHMPPPTPGGQHLSPPPNMQATNVAPPLAQPTLVSICDRFLFSASFD